MTNPFTDEMMPVNDMMTQEDEIEGSGEEPEGESNIEQPSVMSRVRKLEREENC